MSYIPAKKMPHITAQSGEFDPETGKIIHLHPETTPALRGRLPELSSLNKVPTIGWMAGGAGLAVVALGAFFALRSSTPKKRMRRRATTKRATPVRRSSTTTAKRKAA